MAFGEDPDGALIDEPSPTTSISAVSSPGSRSAASRSRSSRSRSHALCSGASVPRRDPARISIRRRGRDELASRGTRGAVGSGSAEAACLSRMSAPPMDSMPRIRTAFARGLAATWSSPLVVGATVAWLLIEWLVVVALGYPGPFALLAHIVAPAPLSTTTDLSVSIGILGVGKGLPLGPDPCSGARPVARDRRGARRGGGRDRSRQPVGGDPRVASVPRRVRDPRLRCRRVVHVADRGGARRRGPRVHPAALDPGPRDLGVRVRTRDRGHGGAPVPRLPRSRPPSRSPAGIGEPDLRRALRRPVVRDLPSRRSSGPSPGRDSA